MYTIDEIKKMEPKERAEVLAMHAKLQKKKTSVTLKVERIPKNGYNTYFKYEYSTESDVKDGIRPILSEAGLSLTPRLVEDSKMLVDTKQGKQWLHTVEMEFTLTDTDTGYMEIVRSKGEGTDSGDKGIYKAYAGCIKYYLINNFQISTGERDADPEHGDTEQKLNQKNNKYNNQPNNQPRGNGNQKGNGGKNNANKPQQKDTPQKVNRVQVEAKWRQLKGNLEGLDDYIKQKNGDLEAIDKILLGRIQAETAKARKEEQEKKERDLKDSPEDFDKDLKEMDKPVIDAETGKTVEYEGKQITLE